MRRLGAFITPGRSLDEAVDRVRLAESLGYEIVFDTHIAARDGLMVLAAYGHGTSTIKLGTGVLPAFPRHPVSLAIEAATLDEMIGGRLVLGIGPSHQITMETWYGISMDKPLSRMKEYLSILRSIFDTGSVAHSGDFYTANYGFMGYQARAGLPIYVSALAPNMLRWAGAAADGVVLWSCLPSYIAETVVPAVRAGAEAAGRDPSSVEILAAVPAALTDDPGAARDTFRKGFFTYMMLPYYRRVIAGAGYAEDIAAFDAATGRGDMPAAHAAISDPLLDEFTAIGDAATIAQKLDEYEKAGVTLPCLGLFPSGEASSPDATLEAAAGR